MRIKTLLAGTLVAVALSTPASGVEENSLRLRLLESSSADSIYSMDDRSTLVTSTVPGALAGELEGFCTKNGGNMKASQAPGKLSLSCAGFFEAENLEGKLINGKPVFVIRHSTYEPFAFKNPAYPAMGKLVPPARTGRLPGYYSGLDLYQYSVALCREEGGRPSTVVAKRDGKTVRLSEVTDAEGFGYIFENGDGKDPWYMECSGGNRRFLVEKNYRYAPDDDNEYFFHPGRGLDGINYVRLGSDKVASLGIMLDEDERAGFAQFLNMSGLEAFSGGFDGRKMD